MLRTLRLYLKVTIFQPELQEHAPRTTFVLKSCDFQAGAAADQGGIEPATAGLRKQARKPRDNFRFQRPFREQEYCTAPQREHFDTHNLRRGFAETKTNSHGATAEGRAQPAEIVKSPQFLNLDHANLRRGSRAASRNRKKSSVFEPRPRESPQRVARGQQKS